MPQALSARSLSRCANVAPELVAVAVAACPRSAVDFGIAREQTRTVAEQRELVRIGNSKTMASKHMPQGGGPSEALDLVAWVDGAFDQDNWNHYYAIAAAMRDAAIEAGVRLVWGGVWDRCLNDLPAGAEAMRAAVAAYVARRKKLKPGKPVFIDGPHFEIMKGL